MRWLRCCLGLLFAACSPVDDPPVGAVGPVQDPPAFVDGELRIDLEPRGETVVMPIIGPLLDQGFEDHITYESPLTLALGAAYPSSFRVALGDVFTQCQLPVSYEIDGITADAALHAAQSDAAAFELAPDSEGEFELVVTGTASYEAAHACAPEGSDGTSAFDVTVRVFVQRPAAVRIDPPDVCQGSETHYLESGARLSADWIGLRVSLLDDTGEQFYPSNASPERPISLVVRAEPGTLLGLHGEAEGLAALVAKGDPGLVQVESELGPAFEFELIGPDRIDAMDVQFNLMGLAGGGIPDLVSGETYGPAFARTSSSIDVTTLGLYAGLDRVCTSPSPLSFELSTSTPFTCAVFAAAGHGDGSGGEPVGVSADVIESGVCSLELQAPLFAAGAGLSAELSVTFLGADGLISLVERR